MERSVERLSGISFSLLQAVLARSDDRISRLVHNLDETNERLIDLSAGYAETKALSQSTGFPLSGDHGVGVGQTPLT